MDERLALSEHRIEGCVTEFAAALDAGVREVSLDQRELEGQGGYGRAETRKYFRLETLHIDLDELRRSVPRNQRIERRQLHGAVFGPVLSLPAGCVLRSHDEVSRRGGDGWVVEV